MPFENQQLFILSFQYLEIMKLYTRMRNVMCAAFWPIQLSYISWVFSMNKEMKAIIIFPSLIGGLPG